MTDTLQALGCDIFDDKKQSYEIPNHVLLINSSARKKLHILSIISAIYLHVI